MKKTKQKKEFTHFDYWWGEYGYIVITVFILLIVIIATILIVISVVKEKNKIVVSEYEISSFSDKENEDFIIGMTDDGKQFLIYTEKNGGLVLKKYDTDKTTIFKTLSENEKPYVKVKSNKSSGVKNVEIYVSDNAVMN